MQKTESNHRFPTNFLVDRSDPPLPVAIYVQEKIVAAPAVMLTVRP